MAVAPRGFTNERELNVLDNPGMDGGIGVRVLHVKSDLAIGEDDVSLPCISTSPQNDIRRNQHAITTNQTLIHPHVNSIGTYEKSAQP